MNENGSVIISDEEKKDLLNLCKNGNLDIILSDFELLQKAYDEGRGLNRTDLIFQKLGYFSAAVFFIGFFPSEPFFGAFIAFLILLAIYLYSISMKMVRIKNYDKFVLLYTKWKNNSKQV